MASTPGFIAPSMYPTQKDLEKEIQRSNKASGFTPFEPSDFFPDIIEHVGVKGMKWGIRKNKESKPPSTTRKIATRVGGALFAAVGAVVVVGLFIKTGNVPAKPTKLTSRRVAMGQRAALKVQSRSEWKKDVNSVLKDIERANAEQDRWMRSLGLGAVVNRQ